MRQSIQISSEHDNPQFTETSIDRPRGRADTRENCSPSEQSDNPVEYAMVPVSLVRSPNLADGPLILLAWLIGLHGKTTPPARDDEGPFDRLVDRPFHFTHARAARELGVTRRSVRNWCRELRQREILHGSEWEYHLTPDDHFGEVFQDEDLWWFPLPIRSDLPPHLWRTWAVLRSYKNRHGIASPSTARLAECIGKAVSKVDDHIHALVDRGIIERQRRRRSTAQTRFMEVCETTQGRNETGDQGGTRRGIKEERDGGSRERDGGSRRNETGDEYKVSSRLMVQGQQRGAVPSRTREREEIPDWTLPLMSVVEGSAAKRQQQPEQPARQGEASRKPIACWKCDRDAVMHVAGVWLCREHQPISQRRITG